MTKRVSTEPAEAQFADYDFLDFGCSKGGSMEFAQATFGGRGLGLDIDPAKVAASKAAGFDAAVQDVSYATYKWIEVPFIRFGKRPPAPQANTAAA